MRNASSAKLTWRAFASASEYTAATPIPMRRAVLATRQAISPRFAIRILRNTLGLSRNPRRLALLEERRDAFLPLGRDADLGDALRGVVDHCVVDCAGRDETNQVLDLRQRLRPTLRQVFQNFPDVGVELFRRRHHGEQTNTVGLIRIEDLSCQKIPPSNPLPHSPHHIRTD